MNKNQDFFDRAVLNGGVSCYKYFSFKYRQKYHTIYFCYLYGIPTVFSTKYGKLVKGKWRNDMDFVKKCFIAHTLGGHDSLSDSQMENLFSETIRWYIEWFMQKIETMPLYLTQYKKLTRLFMESRDNYGHLLDYMNIVSLQLYNKYDNTGNTSEDYVYLLEYLINNYNSIKNMVINKQDYKMFYDKYSHIIFELDQYMKIYRI